MLSQMAVFHLFSRPSSVPLCVRAMSSFPGHGDSLLLLLYPLPQSWGYGEVQAAVAGGAGGRWVWSESSCVSSQLLLSSHFGK